MQDITIGDRLDCGAGKAKMCFILRRRISHPKDGFGMMLAFSLLIQSSQTFTDSELGEISDIANLELLHYLPAMRFYRLYT
jgi:hypothetical protein